MIIVWRVTENCNLTCPFCAFDRSVKRSRREADIDRILSFGRVLSDYAQLTGDEILVSWLGGEPLLWPPLRKLTETFHHELGLKVSTTTNGTSLSSRGMRTHLLDHYAELSISVDGIGKTHDALRGWPGGYVKIRKGILTLTEEKRRLGRGPKLRANIVLMRNNFEELEPLCLELASWGIATVTFNQLGGRDRPEFYPDNRLLPNQADRLAAELPRLRDELAIAGLILQGGPEYIRRIQATTRGERMSVEECFPGKRFLFIDEVGMAAPCSFTVDEWGVPISKIDSVETFLALGEYFARAKRRKPSEACADCHSTQVFDKFAGEG